MTQTTNTVSVSGFHLGNVLFGLQNRIGSYSFTQRRLQLRQQPLQQTCHSGQAIHVSACLRMASASEIWKPVAYLGGPLDVHHVMWSMESGSLSAEYHLCCTCAKESASLSDSECTPGFVFLSTTLGLPEVAPVFGAPRSASAASSPREQSLRRNSIDELNHPFPGEPFPTLISKTHWRTKNKWCRKQTGLSWDPKVCLRQNTRGYSTATLDKLPPTEFLNDALNRDVTKCPTCLIPWETHRH